MKLMISLVEIDKVDVNMKGEDSASALHWAALRNQLEIAKYLVDKGYIFAFYILFSFQVLNWIHQLMWKGTHL